MNGPTGAAAPGAEPARAAAPSYRGAVAHYLSPSRRDEVKRRWEEPVNHRLLAAAVDALARPATEPLRVVDVGAGVGDGLALLDEALRSTTAPERPVRYTGLDPDPEMVDAGRAAWSGRDGVTFVRGDVRRDVPLDDDVDLWLSAGAPWSHLAPGEVVDALATILAAAGRRTRPSAVVVDVLGRYSLEWLPRWGESRWDYAMSFFHGTGDDGGVADLMSFFDRPALTGAVRTAARRAGVALASLDLHDRSIVVGRHTSTGAFHDGLPDYRGTVNALHRGDVDVALPSLHLSAPARDAPDEVRRFFAAFSALWNDLLDRAVDDERHTGASPATRTRLAARLCALEHGAAPGLGVGHSLIAVAVTAP